MDQQQFCPGTNSSPLKYPQLVISLQRTFPRVMLKLSHKRELGKMVDERRAQTVNREDRREKRDERMEK